MSEQDSIPLAEAAQALGVSWERAWRLLLQGQLTGSKKANRWRVTAESVEALKLELGPKAVA